ncbi:MAG: type II toxin-antitoxin system PemK/MazF family toxin, partial [Nitrospira sp.]
MARVRTLPRRGDVYWVSLDPTIGSEIKKTRPAVIVSNNSCNTFGARVVVLPLT